MARVLHLHLGEVGLRRAVQVHPAARVEREVAGVGHPEQPEAQPVRVVPALPRVGREEALGGGVRADDQRHLAEPGEDAGARGVEGLGAGGARGVRRGDARAVPAERLGEGGAGDVPAVAVAHGLATDDEVDVLPRDGGVLQRRTRGVHAIADEAAAPLAPRVHAHTEYGDVVAAHWSASSPSSVRWPPSRGEPAPDRAVTGLVGVERLHDQLDLGADPHVVDAVTLGELAQDHDPLGQLDGCERERHVGIAGRDVRRGRLVLRVGVGPDRPAAGQLGHLEAPRRRRRGCGRNPPCAGRTPSRTSCTSTRAGQVRAPVVNHPSMAGVPRARPPPRSPPRPSRLLKTRTGSHYLMAPAGARAGARACGRSLARARPRRDRDPPRGAAGCRDRRDRRARQAARPGTGPGARAPGRAGRGAGSRRVAAAAPCRPPGRR